MPFSVLLCGLYLKFNYDVSDCSIFSSSTADWQGRLLAFHELDQAFENDKCRNSDIDFQRDGTFPLVSSRLNCTRRRNESTRKNRQGAKRSKIEDALVTKKS